MASALFEISNTYDDQEVRVDGKTCCYRCLVIIFSILLGATGGTILVKAIFVRAVAASLHSESPFADVIWHTTHATIAVGVLMALVGVVGASCTSVEGMILYFVLNIVSLMLEIGVGAALITVQHEITAYASITGSCEDCQSFTDELQSLLPTASGLLLTFSICQIFILFVVVRFVCRLRKLSIQNLDCNRSRISRFDSRHGSRRSYAMTRLAQSSQRSRKNLDVSMADDNQSQRYSFRVYTPHRSDASTSLPGSSTPKSGGHSTLCLSNSILSAITSNTVPTNRSRKSFSRTQMPFHSQRNSRYLSANNLFGTSQKNTPTKLNPPPERIIPIIVIDSATSPTSNGYPQQLAASTLVSMPDSKLASPLKVNQSMKQDDDGTKSGNRKHNEDVTSGCTQDGVGCKTPVHPDSRTVCLSDDNYTMEVEICRSGGGDTCEWRTGIPLSDDDYVTSPLSPPVAPPPTPSAPTASNILLPDCEVVPCRPCNSPQ